jgi:hypothetical protein
MWVGGRRVSPTVRNEEHDVLQAASCTRGQAQGQAQQGEKSRHHYRLMRSVSQSVTMMSDFRNTVDRLTHHNTMAEAFQVGDRVRSQGHTATVRFVGPVAGTKGDWIGELHISVVHTPRIAHCTPHSLRSLPRTNTVATKYRCSHPHTPLPIVDVLPGLEWDDVTRGKHDGSNDGVRYFS